MAIRYYYQENREFMNKRKMRRSLTGTIVFSLVFLIAVTLFGAALIGYYEVTLSLTKQYEDTAYMVATAASNVIDEDQLGRYTVNPTKDIAYIYAENRLQNLADSSDSLVIYVARVDVESRTTTFIYDVVGSDTDFTPYEVGYQETTESRLVEGYEALAADPDLKKYVYTGHNDVAGTYTTLMVPIYNSGKKMTAVCCVVMNMDGLTEARESYLINLLIWTVFLSIVVGALWFYRMRRDLVLPLRRIADESKRFSEDPRVAETRLTDIVAAHNEIGELAETVDQMEETIVENIDRMLVMTAEQNRIGAELNVAQQIQENALPTLSDQYPGKKEITIDAIMNPAREVGGDFYDCVMIDEQHMALVIADVSGKGIPASLFMMISKVLIKTECANGNMDPGAVLTAVNRRLCENNEVDMFVTVWLGILNLETGEVTASNAGHEYPVLTNADGQAEFLKDRHGFVLGGMPGIKEKSYTFTMNRGDVLYVYTDGVPEAVNADKEQFGGDRLLHALNREETTEPSALIRNVLRDLEKFVGDEEQFDDTTMLCLRYNGPEDGDISDVR